MSVLDTIIKGVLEDANDRKISDGRLMEMIAAAPAPKNFLENLGKRAVIAEIKRSSPSKGNLA
jgi:indole-3-glycerol phosphate synthase